MSTTVQVRVVDADVAGPPDAKGKPTRAAVTTAEVALVAKDAATGDLAKWPFAAVKANCPHKAGGVHDPAAAPAAGEHLLIVRASGKNPVVQRLTFEASGADLKAKAGWSAGGKDANRRAAAVTLTSEAVKGKGSSITITVTLFAASETVLLAGTEYHGAGTQWHLFAKGRRELYYKAGKVRDGDLVSLVLLESDERLTTVRAADGWLTVGQQTFAAGSTGITTFYDHVHEIGVRAPGTVRELSIISHAWPGGPILRNTGDGVPTSPARDPLDTDGRIKDWGPGGYVATKCASFAKALRKDALFKMWGCSATTAHLRAQNGAHDARKAKKPEAELFEVAYHETRENTSQAHIRHMIAGVFTHNHYGAGAAKVVSCPVFTAPPGMGSNFGMQSGQNVNFVDQTIAPHKKVYTWLQEVFGAAAKPDAEGYIDYAALQKHVKATPALEALPAWSTERWKRDKGDPYVQLRLPMFSLVAGPKLTTSFTVEAKTGLVTAGKKGHLYAAKRTVVEGLKLGPGFALFLASSATGSVGVFVQEDGKVFLMKPDKAGWTLDAAPSPQMVKVGDVWSVDAAAPKLDHKGTLQTVVPAFYW